jgi:hypothetical protein
MMRDYRLDAGPRIEAKSMDSKPTEGKPEIKAEAKNYPTDDLFQSTLNELHQEAPTELLNSLRERLEGIRKTIPNSAKTAEACLLGLASDSSTLLHVLTAAYLINGGVMLKHQAQDESEGEEYLDFNFRELEEELAQLQKK